MKKLISILLISGMILSLSGCSKSDKQAGSNGSSVPASVQSIIDQQVKEAEESAAQAAAEAVPVYPEAAESSTTEIFDSSAAVDSSTVTEAESSVSDIEEDDSEFDVDLTKLSSTIVYSEVFNMLYYPDEYIGKTVRMKGQFALYQAVDENNQPIPDQIYFACIIADATACCSQGLEFVLAGEHVYPDDYPRRGEEITVSGTFETYLEDGYLYVHLVDAVMEV